MHEVLKFFLKWWFFLFFIFLETIALFFTFSKSRFHEAVYNDYTHTILGKIYQAKSDVQTYFSLSEENKKLACENAILRHELQTSKLIKTSKNDLKETDTVYLQEYTYTPVRIINNSIYQQENFLTLNKGKEDGIQVDMGVILPNGIAGLIIKTSPHFSTAISLLNTQIKINTRLKKSRYFGTLSWDGTDHDIVILQDIPKHVPLTKGEVVETDGKSAIFPEGIAIGTVAHYQLDQESATYRIKVKLRADLAAIENAYVVKNLFKKERKSIQVIPSKQIPTR
ncbi:MAG: rod shape-determining protein MreC [Flavobacteriales bacterium AspAUS03]